MKRLFTIGFILLAIADLSIIFFGLEFRWLTKPLILVSLIAYYFFNSLSFNKLFYFGLIAALAGDVFLLGDDNLHFMLGLSSFLLMQVIYTIIFYRERGPIDLWNGIGSLLAIIIAGSLIFYIVPKVNSSLQIPVIIYSLSIMCMVIAALIRKRDIPGYIFVIVGAGLFMISDTVLAINKFDSPTLYGGLVIMGTYIAAQYFIVRGYMAKEDFNE